MNPIWIIKEWWQYLVLSSISWAGGWRPRRFPFCTSSEGPAVKKTDCYLRIYRLVWRVFWPLFWKQNFLSANTLSLNFSRQHCSKTSHMKKSFPLKWYNNFCTLNFRPSMFLGSELKILKINIDNNCIRLCSYRKKRMIRSSETTSRK